MCTVTFLPGIGTYFILTSSRDENKLRKKAIPPRKYQIHNSPVVYPKDMQAGGTWIATGNNCFTLCLLNGAYEQHNSQPPYSKSRGLMLLDFFIYNDVLKFAAEYNFNGIEPFTLLVVKSAGTLELYELKWDAFRINVERKDAILPHIWSSVTLYDLKAIKDREEWFAEWLNSQEKMNMQSIFDFHLLGGEGNKSSDVLMERNLMTTVSITSVQKSNSGLCMKYKDISEDKDYTIRIL